MTKETSMQKTALKTLLFAFGPLKDLETIEKDLKGTKSTTRVEYLKVVCSRSGWCT